MMEPRLRHEMEALEQTTWHAQLWRELTFCWAAAAVLTVLFLLVQGLTGWISPIEWLLPVIGGLIGTVIAWQKYCTRESNLRAVVSAIEQENPEVRHLLAAATEQEPDKGEFRYLQLRVIDEVLQHPRRLLWRESLERRQRAARNAALCAAAALVLALCTLSYGSVRERPVLSALQVREVTVTPGDAEVERGTTLVISARFSTKPPAEAALVFVSASGKTSRILLERHLTDPVFGASMAEVSEAGIYHIEYENEKTRDFKLGVFDYPALVRADASLRYPAYTSLTNKTIPDTLRITAVEGTKLSYTLQLNKPVTKARLVSSGQTLPLQVGSNSVALLSELPLTNSAKYTLALEDAQGRTNKFPSDFVFQVTTNQPPELKLVFPRGDQRVSKLQELHLQGEAMDDFGILRYGFGFGVAGQDPQLLEIGQAVPGRQKKQFNHSVSLEKLGVEVDQVVAYFVWADDYGPDGAERRTYSDIFFGEVRPFDEIFRADQSGDSGEQSGQGQGQGQGNQGVKLAELQKEIVIATWKLQRGKTPTRKP